MRYYYAQINEAGCCFAMLDTYREIVDPNMIQLDSFDQTKLGMTWDSGSSTWAETPVDP